MKAVIWIFFKRVSRMLCDVEERKAFLDKWKLINNAAVASRARFLFHYRICSSANKIRNHLHSAAFFSITSFLRLIMKLSCFIPIWEENLCQSSNSKLHDASWFMSLVCENKTFYCNVFVSELKRTLEIVQSISRRRCITRQINLINSSRT